MAFFNQRMLWSRRQGVFWSNDHAGGSVIIDFLPQKGPDLTPRIHIEFSSASNMAAILRRGPSKWVRLLAWNTADDTIIAGSWFHGRIYENGCSVSPDGTLFAYFATKYDGPKSRGVDYAWTAISKLPWLTALALWPQSETWGGRARFVDNQTLIIDCPHWEPLSTRDKLPEGFFVHPRWIGRDAPEQNLLPAGNQGAGIKGRRESRDRLRRVGRGRESRDRLLLILY